MEDVAALAGVSLKTVSRVVNHEPGVSSALAERVRVASEKLEFRPNRTASSLRRRDGRTGSVGLLLEDLANPYSAAIVRAVEDAARPRGVTVLAGSLDEDPDREHALVREFVARRVDGMIIAPAADDHSYLLSERRSGVAMVFVDRPPRFLEADTVLVSNRSGVEVGVRHLIEHDHRRIAYVGGPGNIATMAERRQGYLDALRQAGLAQHDSLLVTSVLSLTSAEDAVLGLLRLASPPTAIFAAQNFLTVGAIRALRRTGHLHDVAVVGFDDFLLADLLDPPVTVVAQDPGAIGAIAAKRLFHRIDGDTSPAATEILDPQLIVRGSGEIRPSI